MASSIRPAGVADAPLIAALIRELAAYEKLEREAVATPADLERDLFGPAPRVFAMLAEVSGEPAGFALWFYTYSTFQGRHGAYLEDLFVRPAFRGQGLGKALLATLARRCWDEKLGRLQWSVLDWNTPSIAFYESLGARPVEGWTAYRLDGAALAAMAAS